VRVLEQHLWPGNVRELENVIARALIAADGDTIQPENIVLTKWRPDVLPEPERVLPRGTPDVATPVDGDDTPYHDWKTRHVETGEREYLRALLAKTGGNVTRAAARGQLTRSYLRMLLKKYGM
jgi:DNA-binding NtrC family response regulator